MAKKKKEKPPILVKIRKLKTNYELFFDYDKKIIEYIKTLPREHWKGKKESYIDYDGKTKNQWFWIITEAKMGKMIAFFLDNAINFTFENVPKEAIDRLRNGFIERQKKIREVLRVKKESLDYSGENYDFLKIQPYNYQKEAIKFFEINDGIAILGDQPGVGKTLPGFAYGAKYQYKTLVICPATLKLNWRREILKFTNEKAFVFKYKPKKKSKQIAYTKEESLFHILNYESVESYIKFEYNHKCTGKMIKEDGNFGPCDWTEISLKKKYTACPYCETKGSVKSKRGELVGFGDDFGQFVKPEEYDLIIIDECHRMKEMTTGWTKIIHKALKIIPRRILMSGTVIKSRPMEFFSTLNFIEPEEWKNSHNFGVRYCAGFEDNYGWDFKGASNLDELFERVSSRFLRRLKKDVLEELPPKTYVNIPIELNDKEFREYQKLEKETIKEIVDGKEIEKEERFLPKLLKLKLFLGKIKANAAKSMIQDLIDGGEKVVIFSDRTDVANQVYNDFSEIAVLHTGSMDDEDKDLSVVRFQENKKVKVFCGMMITSGVGITLTASSNLFKLGFSWSPADEEQAEDRIHRATTTADKVTITTLYCPDTIDEDIMELLNEKSQIVTKVLDNKQHSKDVILADKNIFQSLVNRLKEKK